MTRTLVHGRQARFSRGLNQESGEGQLEQFDVCQRAAYLGEAGLRVSPEFCAVYEPELK